VKIISLQRLSAAREENLRLGWDRDSECAAVRTASVVVVVVVVVIVVVLVMEVVVVVVVAAVLVVVFSKYTQSNTTHVFDCVYLINALETQQYGQY
jgi:Flp pilus assembly protein TadB